MILDEESLYCSKKCKAWCCRHLVFKATDTSDKRFFDLRRMQIDGDTIVIPFKCKWLNSYTNLCFFYDQRPDSCKKYKCLALKTKKTDKEETIIPSA